MNINNKYDDKIKKRGEQYFKNNLVEYCIKFENKLYGKVVGGDKYNTTVNLEDNSGICSCPYKYNCKHAYALILCYENNIYENGNELFNNLENKSKNELINILKNIIINNFMWKELINNVNENFDNLLLKGKSILNLIQFENKNIYTFKSFLRNRFLGNATNEQLIEMLKEISKCSYLDEDKHTTEIVEMIMLEILKREDYKLINGALEEYNKNKNKLWIIKEYYIEYKNGCI